MSDALFTLRPARESDRPLIDSYTYAEGMDRLPSLERVTVAVNADDMPVGLIRIALSSQGIAHINPVVTYRAWRGYGVGRALVEAAEAEYGELRLVSRGSSKPFYDALGYEECGWDLIEPGVSDDCDGCELREECRPQPMRKRVERSAPTSCVPTLSPVEGRDIAALMDPRPLVIVGAYDPAEERVGFATVIWAMPVSHDPAMVAFALRERSHTMELIQRTGRFSLSVLPPDAESERIVEACGSSTGHTVDKGALVAHRLREDTPVPDHAYGWELCEVGSIAPTGDHLLVIGYVEQAASAAPRDEKGRLAPRETLLCIQHGCYGALSA